MLCIATLAGCNNSSDKKETMDDTARMDKPADEHAHTTPTGTGPELPAIPEGARVYFANLKEGATVKSPFTVKMGTENINVDTANLVVAGSGHHHLMIDGQDSVALGGIIPKDSLHIHFGKAQTETDLSLPPGKHKLTLQFADGLHRSYGGRMAATITVNVKK